MSIVCKYNALDLPEFIGFDDGMRIYYTYAADGRKLRVRYAQLNSHVGPITPIEDPFPMGGGTAGLNGGGMGDPGGGLEPVLDETVLLTRDYCGGHVWRNDTLERVTTDYGYFDEAGTYHAYVKDHQGNVRAVVAGGEAVERDDYYPYGMPIAGACTPSAEGVQPLKYTSKELDRFNRLDLYDFGARPYDPTRCAFLTHDPLAEGNPATGPTAFCAANPVRFTDPTGMNPIFNYYGEFLGCTKEGYTGEVYMYGGSEQLDFSKYSIDELTSVPTVMDLDMFTDSQQDDKEFLSQTLSNVWTHIVSQFDKKRVFDERFRLSSIEGGRIYCSTEPDKKANWRTFYGNDYKRPRIQGSTDRLDHESTVENITSVILAHEWYSHAIKDVGDHNFSHHLAYWATRRFPLYKKTTQTFQQKTDKKYEFYRNKKGTSK